MTHINILKEKRYDSSKENMEILTSLNKSINNKNSCFVLYESPVSYSYLQQYKKYQPELTGWKTDFRQFVSNSSKNSCVFFIEDVWSLGLSKDTKYYTDQDHLNNSGGELFTKLFKVKLYETIRNIKLNSVIDGLVQQ